MINITDKHDCVGCNACYQRCPVNCITMHEDTEGFLYPHVDTDRCINCGLCERVCPVIHQAEERMPLHAYAAKNNNSETRAASSSGGIFTALAHSVIKEGGVVFGARFNDKWEVVHDYTETADGIKAFQGSKYVQSRIGSTFLQAEHFLKSHRKVLFSGTPCQLAALRLFLRKDYGTQLLAVDVACHGVPSPLVWREYLSDLLSGCPHTKLSELTSINFRDTRHGWRNYRFSVTCNQPQNGLTAKELVFEPSHRNLFMRGYISHLYMRPSCNRCPAKCGKSGSDITLADYWKIDRIHPDFYDSKGVSLVLANTEAGNSALTQSPVTIIASDYLYATTSNPALIKSFQRSEFADKVAEAPADKKIKVITETLQQMRAPLYQRIANRLKYLIENVIAHIRAKF